MNTTGFIRGYMAKNMSAESFIQVVAEALVKEFEEEVNIVFKIENEYVVLFKDYSVSITNDLINDLKEKSPYAVDKHLLQEFRKQGFSFNENRSQYIRYCWI
jgi:thermostable 8-oxoguanine DNA glycosylase